MSLEHDLNVERRLTTLEEKVADHAARWRILFRVCYLLSAGAAGLFARYVGPHIEQLVAGLFRRP